MNLGLKGQAAIVAGGASGIGKAIAEAFAAEGCLVGTIDRTEHSGEHALQADVQDYVALQNTAVTFLERFGRVDHAIFAAGAGSGKYGFPFWNLEPSDWENTLRINLIGGVNFAHTYCPLLREQKEGTLLFLASVAGQIGSPTDPPYSAAKAGLINFMQCAAQDLAPHGIRANAISPGMVKTPINRSVWEAFQKQLDAKDRQTYEAWADAKIKTIAPMNRWQTPEECAALAVFLASPLARNITGQTLNVDGGQVMHS